LKEYRSRQAAFELDRNSKVTSWVKNDLGKLQEARKLYGRALKIRREKLGEDHPATKRSVNNLKPIGKI
jgi:hypothetical protein